MIAPASTRTPSRRMSTFPSAVALRNMSSTAILSSAIVISLRVVGSSLQRREDDAMADSFVSRFGCYTIIWDTTRQGRRVAHRAAPGGRTVLRDQPAAIVSRGTRGHDEPS